VYALKPSYGVIPNVGYLDHVGDCTTRTDINTFGPMARSADDLELLLSVLAGPVPEDELAWRVELPASTATSLAGLRVATWLDDDACPVDAEYVGLLRAAADALADAGAQVDDVHPEIGFQEQIELYLRLVAAAVSPGMPEEVAEQISRSHLEWLRHDEERVALRRRWAGWFEDFDVLLAPAWCTPPFEHDHTGDMTQRVVIVNSVPRNHLELSYWLMLVNLINQPSAMVPIGRTGTGLPVGMQVIAPYLHDRHAIRVAELASEVLGGYDVPPGFE
jgi:amidase